MIELNTNNKIICIDTETGGLDATKNAICSVTFKTVNEDNIKTWLIKPNPENGLCYDDRALEINGFSLKQLENEGVPEQQAVSEMLDFIKLNRLSAHRYGSPTMLAHNVMFDMQFLNALFTRNNVKNFSEYVHYHTLDTMIIMKFLKLSGLVNINAVNLHECYKHFFNKDFENAHTSHADVIATEAVFNKVCELLQNLKQ
jgi:DNA polymerase III epsilon subunit-like protein